MDDFAHMQIEMQASIDSQISVTLGLTLMLKSYEDLNLGEVSGAQI
jgi:hypothetical protein